MFIFNLICVIIYFNRAKVLKVKIEDERIGIMAGSKRADDAQRKRRKRVSRLKTVIIIAAMILLLASVVLNFVLLVKVFHLQNQVEKLYSATSVVAMERLV
jgi:hypothetical protein